MHVEILIAVIGGICGIAGAIVSAVYSRRLAAIQSELDEQRDVRKARRDYEYEARKRLYATYEPIKFQLVDLIGQALRRISALSLVAPETGSREQTATVYELLAPAALVRMLDRNLTLADMHLEPQVSVEYGLMKAAYRVLTDTSSLASLCSGLPGGARDYGHFEALLPYELDEAADALLRITPDDISSGVAAGQPGGLLTFSQFSSAFTELSTEGSGLASMTALLAEFTPRAGRLSGVPS